MTKKLYYSSPPTTSWKTKITSCIQQEEFYLVTLEATAFYPEGGGQPADTGLINEIEVIEVFEKDGEVYHKLPHPPPGDHANCEINWDRRFDHTQQHTGQHLLSAVCIDLYDAHTSSFHLGKEVVSIDLSVPELTKEQLSLIEDKVNQVIYQNKEIKTYIVTEDELQALQLRKTPDVNEDIRIVEIENIDISACCGTHVSRTGELGMIKLLKTEKHRGNTRLFFICGHRALRDYRDSHEVLSSVTASLSTNRDGLVDILKKNEQDYKQLQKEIEQLKLELNRFYASDLVEKHEGSIISISFEDKSFKEIQGLAQQLQMISSKPIILTSLPENKLLLAHSGSLPIHCGQIFKAELPSFNGKGGGNPSSAQAGFTTVEDLQKFVAYLEEHILTSTGF